MAKRGSDSNWQIRLRYLLGGATFILGIVAGIAIRHYFYIPLNETLNIIDLATLATTIFLALYIPAVLDRHLQIRQDKKRIIGERIDELQALYRRVNMTVQQGERLTQKDILLINNNLDVATHRLDTVAILFEYIDVKDTFQAKMRSIKRLTTEYRKVVLSFDPEGDIFSYPYELREKEEQLYNEIDRATCLVLFEVSDK